MTLPIQLTHIDTACMVISINGFRILTDPTLDAAGGVYHHGFGALSRKTDNPAVSTSTLANIDLILLSHHQHKDNFDDRGKAFAASVKNIISTKAAARDLDGVTGLAPWESITIETPKVPGLKITATPAQHRPWWVPEFVSGSVIGFIIEYDQQSNGVLYITGDTVYFGGLDEVGKRYKIDIGIYHLGAVQFRYLTGFGKYTMDSSDFFKAVRATTPATIIPIHYKGWTHFKEHEAVLRQNIHNNGSVRNKVVFLQPGIETPL